MDKIDNLDKKILSILSKNARIPFKDVATVCGVSRAAIHQRVQHLIEGGIITGSGFNAVKWIVDDLIYEKDFDDEPVIADNEDSLYTVVPKDVLMNYVKDDALRQRVKELYAKGCVHDPLSYKGERNLIRRLYPIYFMWKQRKKFRP